MSMIQKEVRDFQVQAYQNGAFQTVSKADVSDRFQGRCGRKVECILLLPG